MLRLCPQPGNGFFILCSLRFFVADGIRGRGELPAVGAEFTKSSRTAIFKVLAHFRPETAFHQIVLPPNNVVLSFHQFVLPFRQGGLLLHQIVVSLHQVVAPPTGIVLPFRQFVLSWNNRVLSLHQIVLPLNNIVLPFH
jgi:hypothetical protein